MHDENELRCTHLLPNLLNLNSVLRYEKETKFIKNSTAVAALCVTCVVTPIGSTAAVRFAYTAAMTLTAPSP